jgi:glycosyltransferase involved in cell wall biosynthesis
VNVSILICTFGEAKWRDLAINRALRSAQSQKEAFEVNAWHEPDGTLASSRNAAAKEASGDYLCFLDADDELAPGYIEAMIAAWWRVVDTTSAVLPLPEQALYVPAVQYVYRDKDGEREESEPQLLNTGRPLVEINRAVIGSPVPRQLFLDLQGFKDLPALEDWELWLRVSRFLPLIDVPDAVYRAFVRPGSRNADQSLYWKIRREFESTAKMAVTP